MKDRSVPYNSYPREMEGAGRYKGTAPVSQSRRPEALLGGITERRK
jgi:hypothetical protein